MTELLLTSPLLTEAGFRHGFSTRLGGVSRAPFDSMNLARAVGDDPTDVDENYRRFAAALGVEVASLYETNQVHGERVHVVEAGDDVVRTRALDADALVAATPSIAVGVRVADCVPILLAHPRTGLVAAVHAGWRGCVARVATRAIDVLEAHGAKAEELVAAIGPHIGPASFEVGEDVASAIARASGTDAVIVRGYERPHVDLARVVRLELGARGVASTRVDHVPGCTFAEPSRFHSFRRDGKRSGRHIGAIVSRVGSTPSPW